MKLALGMMVCAGDLPFLKLHLPVLAPWFDGLVIVADSDGCTAETAGVSDAVSGATGLYVDVFLHDWHWDFSEKVNHLLRHGKDCGYDAMIRLDPDELLHPEHIGWIKGLLHNYSVALLPRYNFFGDRLHIDERFPDPQYRAYRLDGRCTYVGKIHEGLLFTGPNSEVTYSDKTWIYHYGNVSRSNIRARQLRYINFDRHRLGFPPLAALPPDVCVDLLTIPFTEKQPLDPAVCGLYAPFTED